MKHRDPRHYSPPSPTEVARWSRRHFLGTAGAAGLGGLLLGGCGDDAPSTPTTTSAAAAPTTSAAAPTTTAPAATTAAPVGLTEFASMWSDDVPRGVMEQIVADYRAATGNEVDMSTTPIEEYKSQIRTFLAADSPPDVLTWFAGERARFFVDRGLILDISDVWDQAASSYADAFRALSTTDGRQFFLPSQWYWWGLWYRKSLFEENGYQPASTWDEFLGLLDNMASDGLSPITIGTRNNAWTSAGWFDYLNLRTNGYDFHVSLTAGGEDYTDERVRAVFDHWAEVLPYFNPDSASFAWQEAVTPIVNNESAMYLMGRFVTDAMPEDVRDDMDFFRFPTIEPDVGTAEEAPVDGYFASANSSNPEGAREFLSYLAGVDAQTVWVEGAGQIAANPDVPSSLYSPLVQRGIEHIAQTENIAQFYDRDTNPEMAAIGMDGFVEFMANPSAIDDILSRLQNESARIFGS